MYFQSQKIFLSRWRRLKFISISGPLKMTTGSLDWKQMSPASGLQPVMLCFEYPELKKKKRNWSPVFTDWEVLVTHVDSICSSEFRPWNQAPHLCLTWIRRAGDWVLPAKTSLSSLPQSSWCPQIQCWQPFVIVLIADFPSSLFCSFTRLPCASEFPDPYPK